MKKIYLLLIPALILFLPIVSKAYVVKSSDFIYIAKDEIVEGNLYFSCKSLNIEGQVLGDVIGVSQNIQVNGQISGDLIALSQNISITGQIDGNTRVVSNTLNINGVINKNLNFLGESILLGENSMIEQDVLLKSINSEFNGKIKGNIHGATNNMLIRGEVDKNVNILIDHKKKKKYYNTLQIEESAKISGSLNYRAGKDANIKSKNVSGEIIKKEPIKSKNGGSKINKFIYSILSGFLLILLLNYFFKNKIKNLKKIITEKNIKLSGYGAIILFLTPIAILILTITIIGAPIAIISLIIWLILLYLSRLIIAITIGDFIFKFFKKDDVSDYIKIVSGLIISWLLFCLPYIGWIFSLLAIIIGLGSMYYLIIKNKKNAN